MSVESNNPNIQLIVKYLWYSILLASWLFIQSDLKEMPQIVMVILSGVITLIGFFGTIVVFRAVNVLLKIILMYTLVFQVLYNGMQWLNPNKGYVLENGERVQLMDMSGFFWGIIALIVAFIYAFSTVKLKSKESIQPEFHLAIATFLGTTILFVIFEIL